MNKSSIKRAVFLYTIFYTAATILNSIIYLMQGIGSDSNGNWHEIDRAIIVLIGVLAFELFHHLKAVPLWLRFVAAYVLSQLLAFGYVWLAGFRGDELAASAYRDMWINFTAGYLILCLISILVSAIKKKALNRTR